MGSGSWGVAGAAGVVLAVGVVAACGETQGAPVAEKAPVQLTLNPCEVFPPEALEAAGLQSKDFTRYEDIDDPYPSWACGFRGVQTGPYAEYGAGESSSGATVSLNGRTLEDVDADKDSILKLETVIEGHRAMLHQNTRATVCVAAVEVGEGVIEFMVGYTVLDPGTRSVFPTVEEACDKALQVARDLGPYYPEHL